MQERSSQVRQKGGGGQPYCIDAGEFDIRQRDHVMVERDDRFCEEVDRISGKQDPDDLARALRTDGIARCPASEEEDALPGRGAFDYEIALARP